MKINESSTYTNDFKFYQAYLRDKSIKLKEETSEDEKIEDQETDNIEAFKALCEKFPNVEFVVVDEIGAIQPEYRGICRTPAFGNLNQISIMIDRKVVENLENDYENIISKIQMICDRYESDTKQAAIASGVEYTALHLHYINSKTLSCWQIYWPDGAPIICREEAGNWKKDINTGINEKNLQFFLLNIQKKLSDKLFEVGENKQGHKVKSAQEGSRVYQEHFIYEKKEERKYVN